MLTDVPTKTYAPTPRELDPKHPGVNDPLYVRRRHELYDLAYDYRIHDKGWPTVAYTAQEDGIWREISAGLVEAHRRRACSLYLRGKQLLQIESQHMPQLGELDRKLQRQHGFGLVPAEGLIDVRLFFSYLSARRMPATQFLRHHKVPGFTPEPDAVHDVIGHVPCLMDREYTDIVQMIGEGVLRCDDAQLAFWSRLYWHTIEFGLIREGDEVKVFGAGLLSSLQEIDHCFSDEVRRRPFVLEDVIACDYDPSCMQETIFVIPSMGELRAAVELLRQRFVD